MRTNILRLGLSAAVAILIGGCSGSGATSAPTPAPVGPAPAVTGPTAPPVAETSVPGFVLTSPAFADGGAMPSKFTCDGGDTSPGLHWAGAPTGTISFVLIVEDPDASNFVHWVAWDILSTGSTGDLAEDVTKAQYPAQAMNSFGANGYRGPCPPSGTHHYVFTLYALNSKLTVDHPDVATADDIRAAMKGLILARTVLTGTYAKPS